MWVLLCFTEDRSPKWRLSSEIESPDSKMLMVCWCFLLGGSPAAYQWLATILPYMVFSNSSNTIHGSRLLSSRLSLDQ